MTEDELIELINTTLQNENEDSEINVNVTIDSEVGDDGWDSLGQLGVLAALDCALDGKVAAIQEIGGSDSVTSLIHILKKNNLM